MTETHTTALLVLDGRSARARRARVVRRRRRPPTTLLLGASMTKSVLAHLVGNAIASGALRLEDPVAEHVPELAGSGYAACTVEHLLTMTTGVDWVEDHRDPTGPATPAARLLHRRDGGSRDLLTADRARWIAPGTRWEYYTADSQVLDWVRERATGTTYAEALSRAVARPRLRPGRRGRGRRRRASPWPAAGWPPAREDWARLAALQLDRHGVRRRACSTRLGRRRSAPPATPFSTPGRLPSTITTHAGFGYHWWPLDRRRPRVTSDGSRGQFGYVDRDLGVAVLKTSLWPYDDFLVDRQQRDLSYLGLPDIAAAAAKDSPEHRDEGGLMRTMNRKVIITCALTGAGDTVGRSEHVPVTPEQIAESGIAAARAGATVVHVHVREPETGKGSREVALLPRGRRADPRQRRRRHHQHHRRHGRRPDARPAGPDHVRRGHRPGQRRRAAQARRGADAGHLHARLRQPQLRRGQPASTSAPPTCCARAPSASRSSACAARWRSSTPGTCGSAASWSRRA